MSKSIITIITIISLFFIGCKKDRYDDLYPTIDQEIEIKGKVTDSLTNKPLKGIPIFIKTFKTFGETEQFGPFLTDSNGIIDESFILERKVDSMQVIYNVATLPFQSYYLKPYDSTAIAFQYLYYQKIIYLEQGAILGNITLLPNGQIQFLSDATLFPKYDSVVINSKFDHQILKKGVKNTPIFYVHPSQEHSFTFLYYNKGVSTEVKKNIFIPNAFGNTKDQVFSYLVK